MAPNNSNLTHSSYGYDFVVATTQESINAGLVQYFMNTGKQQPTMYLCFLGNKAREPAEQKTLAEMMELSKGVNPFEIEAGTPYEDPRIKKLSSARFLIGIAIQPGIPPGLMKPVQGKGLQLQLPDPIVTLGTTIEKIKFNMYCSNITIIKNNPPIRGGDFGDDDDGIPGSWVIYKQPSGSPWYLSTFVNISVASMDRDLNTEYFRNNPQERELLKDKLYNLSSSAFSLQQLYFNLSSAIAQTLPKFEGIKDKSIDYTLGLTFINMWRSSALQRGLPLIGITAVQQTADGSPLCLTQMERFISPVVDSFSRQQLKEPSAVQSAATTLNYLCAANGNSLPRANSFNWNWVEPDQVGQNSGVISIRRNVIARYLMNTMLPYIRKGCIRPWTKVTAVDVVGGLKFSWSFEPGQSPDSTNFYDSGSLAAEAYYYYYHPSSSSMAATYGELNSTSKYSCKLYFEDSNKFTVVQRLELIIYSQWAKTGTTAKVVDKTLSDEYVISVDANGNLTSTPTSNRKSTDQGKGGDRSGFVNAFTGVNDMIEAIRRAQTGFFNTSLNSIPFDQIKNFVFPGGKVFSYKSAAFSDYQDLTCLITYLNPTDKQFRAPAPAAPITKFPDVIETDQLPPVAALLRNYKSEGSEIARQRQLIEATSEPEPPPGAEVQSSHMQYPVDGNPPLARSTAAPADTASSDKSRSVKLSSTTDMMQNYVQGELVAPLGKFRALQTLHGNALVFAVSSAGVFNVFKESVGRSQTGWTVTDLSSSLTKPGFVVTNGVVRTFDVGQSVMDGNTIGLGISVRVNGSDTLYLSLNNSPTETSSWITNPPWRAFPFDAQNRPSSIQITNIYFSETDQKMQYIMVDILRDPQSALKDTVRYIVDPSSTGSYWTPHTLPFDVEEGTYQSCMGRNAGAYIDGIYTCGTVKGAGQLAYVPIFNISGNAAPMPTRLALPNKTIATAIASARNDHQSSDMYGTTDLYAVGGTTLYRWDPEQQLDNNTIGNAIMTNPVFAGTDTLIALIRNRITTIFGKNASNVVYYTSCPVEKLADPNSWSVPTPIATGVSRITSYINLRDGGNTVYAAGGSTIQQIIQATGTTSKLWQAQAITLEAPPQSKSISFKSYTSTIQVRGEDDLPAGGVELTLTAKARSPVYINGLYYVVSTIPVTVPVDRSGQLTVVQATESLVGPIMTVQAGNSTYTINPMQEAFAKLTGLTDKNALRNAKFTTNTTAGGITGTPTTAPLVSKDVSDKDLQATVDALKQLKEASSDQSKSSVRAVSSSMPSTPVAAGTFGGGLADGIRIAAGDLFAWLKMGVEKAIEFIKNTATGVWDFVVKIAGKVYRAVLDSFEVVVGALQWIFDQIKTAFKDLLKYLELLFEWDDISRTKRIMHKMVRFYLQDMVSGVRDAQTMFDDSIDGAQQAVAKWAGIKDWSGLGDSASKRPGGNAVDGTKKQTGTSQLLANHFKNQARNISLPGGAPPAGSVQSLVDTLINTMSAQGQVFKETLQQLQSLASDFLSLSMEEVFKRLAGILAGAVLGTTKVVVHAMFDVLISVASTAVEILDTKIHIPIISDILNKLGIPDISFLDLIMWVSAAGVTIVYKIVNGKAPFPDDSTSRALLDAQDLSGLRKALWGSSAPAAAATVQPMSAAPPTAGDGLIQLSSSAGNAVYITGHAIGGFVAFFGNFLFFAEAMDSNASGPFSIPASVVGIIGALSVGCADYLVQKMPIEDTTVARFRTATTCVTILSKIMFSSKGNNWFARGPLSIFKADDPRQVGAIFNTVLVVPALFCSCWHFYELSKKPASADRSRAIIGETSMMAQYIGRVAYCTAVLDREPSSKTVAAGVMSGTWVAAFGLEFACAIIY